MRASPDLVSRYPRRVRGILGASALVAIAVAAIVVAASCSEFSETGNTPTTSGPRCATERCGTDGTCCWDDAGASAKRVPTGECLRRPGLALLGQGLRPRGRKTGRT